MVDEIDGELMNYSVVDGFRPAYNCRLISTCFRSLLLQFFISALSFATFSVAPELPQNRLQLSFTLLLTSVAFKFVINQSLPKISYLTYMVRTWSTT